MRTHEFHSSSLYHKACLDNETSSCSSRLNEKLTQIGLVYLLEYIYVLECVFVSLTGGLSKAREKIKNLRVS